MEYFSYLMGADGITDDELLSLGVEITEGTESGSRLLKVPDGALEQYIELLKAKLDKGFWNEIVGADKIVFVFRFKDGRTKEFVLSSDNEEEIGTLCSEFNGDSPEKTINVYKYISNNDFYHDFMMEHYADMINR